jgi:hypothetical protein
MSIYILSLVRACSSRFKRGIAYLRTRAYAARRGDAASALDRAARRYTPRDIETGIMNYSDRDLYRIAAVENDRLLKTGSHRSGQRVSLLRGRRIQRREVSVLGRLNAAQSCVELRID